MDADRRTAPEDLDPIFGPPELAPRKPRRDDRFTARVTGFGPKGRASGRIGPYSVRWTGWVGPPGHGAVPGALLAGEVVRRRRDQLEARVVEVLEPSAAAVEPRCPHSGSCGGCAFQDLAYPAQLDHLRRGLGRTLAPLGLGLEPELEPSPSAFGYRNKMDFTFSNRRWVEAGESEGRAADDQFALGLHVAGRFQKVLDVRSCAIHFEGADALLSDVRDLARASGLAAWDVKAHTGFWRHAVLRRGHHTGEILVHMVTAPVDGEAARGAALEAFTAELVVRHPELTTVVHSQTERLSTVAVGERERALHGPARIHDELLGVRFAISAWSFFQTNTAAAERMLAWIGERLSDERGTLHDLYCGGGAIGLSLAARFERVVGVELVESAVADARANALANGIEHAEFHAGDVPTLLDGGLAGLATPEVAIVDPPRAGLHPRLLERLATRPPRRLVLVSCNPAAAARDLGPLLAGPYELLAARAFDLFPHTPHLECVFDLRRRS